MNEGVDRREFLRRALAAGAVVAVPAWATGVASTGDRRVKELARSLAGPVIARGARGYAQARLLFNPRFDAVKPLVVAYPQSAADVAKAIRWARKYGVRVAARCGGHSYGGYSTTPGLVLDVTRLSRVRVNGDGTASVGAGSALVDVYDRLARGGVTIPAGSCPTVGVAGLALGGGVGFASRKLGLTCDNVLGLTIVTASGDVLTCSESENPDLFWACRGGGGGNFGVVTDFTFRATPVSSVSTFSIEWPWANARDVLAAWQGFAPVAPDELFSVLNLRAAAGVAPRVSSGGQFFGSEAQLRSLLAPLTAVGAPISVKTSMRTYMQAVFLWAGCGSSVAGCHLAGRSPGGTIERVTYKGKSDYAVQPLSAEGIDAIVRAIEARQGVSAAGSGGLLLDSYGGAIARVPKEATAFVHRDALFSFQYLATWATGAPASVAAANLAWIRGFYAAMRPYVSGFAYQNYIDPELAGWQRAYYGSNFGRLVEVKRRYDPDGLFRFAQGIPLRA